MDHNPELLEWAKARWPKQDPATTEGRAPLVLLGVQDFGRCDKFQDDEFQAAAVPTRAPLT